jgi:hypothetical protein
MEVFLLLMQVSGSNLNVSTTNKSTLLHKVMIELNSASVLRTLVPTLHPITQSGSTGYSWLALTIFIFTWGQFKMQGLR